MSFISLQCKISFGILLLLSDTMSYHSINNHRDASIQWWEQKLIIGNLNMLVFNFFVQLGFIWSWHIRSLFKTDLLKNRTSISTQSDGVNAKDNKNGILQKSKQIQRGEKSQMMVFIYKFIKWNLSFQLSCLWYEYNCMAFARTRTSRVEKLGKV